MPSGATPARAGGTFPYFISSNSSNNPAEEDISRAPALCSSPGSSTALASQHPVPQFSPHSLFTEGEWRLREQAASPRVAWLVLAPRLAPPLTPCSPSPEWFASSTQSYILRDLDDTSVVEDGRKKLNTLAHYKVGSQPRPAPTGGPPDLTSDLSLSTPARSPKVPRWP